MCRQTLSRNLLAALLVVMFNLAMTPIASARDEQSEPSRAGTSIQKPPPGFPKPSSRKSHTMGKKIARDLARFNRTVTISTDHPITVFPEGVGFDDLQEAFSFCSRKKWDGKAGSRQWSYLVLQPGIYVGNYNFPENTVVIGDAGPMATLIVGATGTNEPALKAAAPSGPTLTEFALVGIGVIGRAVAGLTYTGTNAHSDLYIENCLIYADASQATPAIGMVGSGYGMDQEFEMIVVRTDIESALDAACAAQIGDYADVEIAGCEVFGYTLAMDIQGSGSTESGIDVYDSLLEGEDSLEPAINVIDVNWLTIHDCEIEAAGGGDAVYYSGSFGGVLERCEIYSESGDGVELNAISWFEMSYNKISAWDPSARAVWLTNSAYAYLYYTGLNATTDIDADSTSGYTLTYCH